MANNCIEKDIIDDLISSIQDVTIANDYPITIDSEAVTDDFFIDLDDVARFECVVYVMPTVSVPADMTGNQTNNFISWEVLAFVRPGTDAIKDRYSLAGSIRDAIMTDVRRSEQASRTTIDETEWFVVDEDENFVIPALRISGHCYVHQSITNYRGA